MPKITIIDGNNEVELSTIEDNVKAFMVKGEPGTDGISPTASVSKTGDTATITITDKNGTTEADVIDGFDPTASVSKVDDTTTITITDKNGTTSADVIDGFDPTVTTSRSGKVTTVTITDIDGTRTTEIYDGIDLTGGVPTDGVIGWDGNELIYTCDGTETGDYYFTYDSVDYYFTMPTVEDGDVLLFNINDLGLSLNGTTITTSSSGTGTELTFIDYVPNGYELTNPMPVVVNSYSTSTTDVYSAYYTNKSIEVQEDISIGLLNDFTFDSIDGRIQAPYLKRVGNIVFFKCILSLSTNIPTAETPAISIPEGYRPKGFTSFGALSNNHWNASSDICYIRCNGSQIMVRNSSGNDYKLVHIDLSWVIEN